MSGQIPGGPDYRAMHRVVISFAAALALVFPMPGTAAQPAIWTVHGAKGTAYLVSSVHLLPPDVDWHSQAIDLAMHRADTFVFEVPDGESERQTATDYILANGFLPAGETLSHDLSDDGRKNYERALDLAGLEEKRMDQKRPWLVQIVLTVEAMRHRNYSDTNTPEGEAAAYALRAGKEVRYLDSTLQQLQLLQAADNADDLGHFATMLADFPNQPERERALVDAWASGDVAESRSLIDAGFRDLPLAKRRLDERNHDWADQLARMLDSEKRTAFVTVGIAHLVGPDGLPALLQAKGLRVDGP